MNSNFSGFHNNDNVINLKENPDEIFVLHPLVKLGDLKDAIECQLLAISSKQDLENSQRYDYKPRKKWIDE